MFRDDIKRGLSESTLTRELLAAHLAALERIDGNKLGDLPDPALLLPIVKDDAVPPHVRAYALRLLPARHSALSIGFLKSLFAGPDRELRLEVLRTINEGPTPERRRLLVELARDEKQDLAVRAEATSGLAGDERFKSELLDLALGDNATLRDEALRSLVDVPLNDEEKKRISKSSPADLGEAARLLGYTPLKPDNWLDRIVGEGDSAAGRRIFFHSKVGYCSRCHSYDGRGNQLGPDLTKIHERGREWLLTSMFQPARDVAPAYRQWQIVMKDGRTHVGVSLRKGSHSEDYLGADGKTFSVKLADVESRSEIDTSMMPEGLPQSMTVKELGDVMAFLLNK
jgi:putative heme-binding domain-containing protein